MAVALGNLPRAATPSPGFSKLATLAKRNRPPPPRGRGRFRVHVKCRQIGEEACSTRHVGRTGWDLAEIGFGSWQLGADWGPVSDGDAIATLHAALDGGVNFIDTADVYGDGRSEQLIARALKGRGGARPLVATKLGRRSQSAYRGELYAREHDRASSSAACATSPPTRSISSSCTRRRPTSSISRIRSRRSNGLVRQGKIRRYGVSVEKVEEGIKALEYPGVGERPDHLQHLPAAAGRAVLQAGEGAGRRGHRARAAGERPAVGQVHAARRRSMRATTASTTATARPSTSARRSPACPMRSVSRRSRNSGRWCRPARAWRSSRCAGSSCTTR